MKQKQTNKQNRKSQTKFSLGNLKSPKKAMLTKETIVEINMYIGYYDFCN